MVSSGVIRVQTRDFVKAERSTERRGAHRRVAVDMAATFLAGGQACQSYFHSRGTIVAWERPAAGLVGRSLSDLAYAGFYRRCQVCSDCGTDYEDKRAARAAPR